MGRNRCGEVDSYKIKKRKKITTFYYRRGSTRVFNTKKRPPLGVSGDYIISMIKYFSEAVEKIK